MKKFIFILAIALFVAGCNNKKDNTVKSINNSELKLVSSNDAPTVDNNIYDAVDIYPQFEGGMENLPKFLQANLVYPESARLARKQGTVKVQFVVEKNGSITNIKIAEGFDFDCEQEAIRVVSLFPNWIPGKIKGKAVRTRLTLPINYSLK